MQLWVVVSFTLICACDLFAWCTAKPQGAKPLPGAPWRVAAAQERTEDLLLINHLLAITRVLL